MCLDCDLKEIHDALEEEGREKLIEGEYRDAGRVMVMTHLLKAVGAVNSGDLENAIDAMNIAGGVINLLNNPDQECEECKECPASDLCPIRNPGTDRPLNTEDGVGPN